MYIDDHAMVIDNKIPEINEKLLKNLSDSIYLSVIIGVSRGIT